MKHALLALSLLLVACDDDNNHSSPPPVPTSQGLMDASMWEIGPIIDGKNYSHHVGLHPIATADGWAIDIPQQDGVHYVTTRINSLAGKKQIVLRYRVDMEPGVIIVPSSDPTLPSVGPTIYFQDSHDNWEEDGHRWWATFSSPAPIVKGDFILVVPLTGNWTSVQRMNAIDSYAAFEASKNSAARVGFTLGGGTGYGHGVYATGTARLTVTGFEVQ